ncbi:MAG: glycosyltransferase family 2 protein [Pseudomonadota bacterium]
MARRGVKGLLGAVGRRLARLDPQPLAEHIQTTGVLSPVDATDPARDALPMAAMTMCWNEEAYLSKWVAHYGAAFGRENLYIIAHGGEQIVYDLAEGCNVIAVPRKVIDPAFNRRRARVVEALVNFLLTSHRAIVFGDVDEYIIADPEAGSLEDVIEGQRGHVPSLKPLALNLLEHEGAAPLDFSKPILPQRPTAHSRYQFCKPVILFQPTVFVAGFHYSTHAPNLGEDLYLVHLHFADSTAAETIGKNFDHSMEQKQILKESTDRFKNFWTKRVEQFVSYNRRCNRMPLFPLDDMAPELRAAMRENVVVGNPKKPKQGKTMTFGQVDDKRRIEIPTRFFDVF